MTDEREPADVFGLLSNEIRVDILEAVARANFEESSLGSPLSALLFSEIYDRIEVDNTSKLSYHLGELVGVFLHKRADGYVLTHAGDQLVRFILSRNYELPATTDPIETDGTCLYCGLDDLVAVAHERYFFVRCTGCDRPVTGYYITPAQARSHDGEELVASFATTQAMEFGLVQRGVCPACAAGVTNEVVDLEDHPNGDELPARFIVLTSCDSCLRAFSGPMSYAVAYRPAGSAFLWDHGIDTSRTGMWELHEHLLDNAWSAKPLLDDDRGRYRVTLSHGGEELRAYLDASARTRRTERVRAHGHG